jgi:hypothetical protein
VRGVRSTHRHPAVFSLPGYTPGHTHPSPCGCTHRSRRLLRARTPFAANLRLFAYRVRRRKRLLRARAYTRFRLRLPHRLAGWRVGASPRLLLDRAPPAVRLRLSPCRSGSGLVLVCFWFITPPTRLPEPSGKVLRALYTPFAMFRSRTFGNDRCHRYKFSHTLRNYPTVLDIKKVGETYRIRVWHGPLAIYLLSLFRRK